ncbi:MAG: hypothetical protein IJ729_00535 [Alloprevotella sp.]|nr:hypothetical protein [Alloprevotella sp.]
MAYYLEKALEEFEGPYIYLSHHSGFREDVFTTAADREIVYLFGGYENEYNPAIMYNRAVLEGESSVIQGVRDMAPTPYTEALLKAAAMPAKAEVSLQREGGEVRVSGRVARDLVDSPLYISVCLVEDGMTATQYYQTGMDDPDAPADLADVFRHNGVTLHSYNTAPAGDLLAIDADKGTFSVSYPEVEKKGFGGTGRRLVAVVHKVNKDNLRDNEVLNAAQLDLNATGINSVHTTPATDTATYDLLGRRVSHPVKGIYVRNGRKLLR